MNFKTRFKKTTAEAEPTVWNRFFYSVVRKHMGTIGMVLLMGGLLFIMFPALKHARSMNGFTSCLKTDHPEIWLKLGKPEISILYPFRAMPAFKAVEENIPEFEAHPELLKLQHKAKFWFYAYAANFGIIFLGFLMMAFSKAP